MGSTIISPSPGDPVHGRVDDIAHLPGRTLADTRPPKGTERSPGAHLAVVPRAIHSISARESGSNGALSAGSGHSFDTRRTYP
jgi:hypothetical protein